MFANTDQVEERTSKVRRKALNLNNISGWVFVSPLMIGVLGFSIYPMVASLVMSFKQSDGVTGKWVGLSNYIKVLKDIDFWNSLYNTFYMGVLSVVLGIVLSFVLASLINSLPWTKTKNFFKAIYFLPNVVSAVASSLLFSFLFYPTNEGLLNYFLGIFHVHPVGWFTDPKFSRLSIVAMTVWGALGYNTIIFVAALQSVPRELYEAAEVDGANGLQKWRYITTPYLKPIFLFMSVIGTINAMKQFTNVWLIGGPTGNPAGSLMTSVLYIYRNAFMSSQMGIATAASFILFIIILSLTVLLLKGNKRNEF